jgi:hypothetical protein
LNRVVAYWWRVYALKDTLSRRTLEEWAEYLCLRELEVLTRVSALASDQKGNLPKPSEEELALLESALERLKLARAMQVLAEDQD